MSDEGRRFRNSVKGSLIVSYYFYNCILYLSHKLNCVLYFEGGDRGKWRSWKIKYDSTLLQRNVHPRL